MKKFIASLAAIFILIISTPVSFAEEPTCILLKFSDSTRYKNIDSASLLSDLVIEKLLASGKFNLKETSPIDEDIEALLYNEKVRELLSIKTGNLSSLFEGAGFDENQAQTIGTAQVGQIILPEITSKIGIQHGAQYLIQGNIINLGGGTWQNFNPDSDEFLNKKIGLGVQTDLRIIEAATGKVIWQNSVIGLKETELQVVLTIPFGSSKLTSDMYNQAMENAAQKIYDALIKDLAEGKLFVK